MRFIQHIKPLHLRLLLKTHETGQLQVAARALGMSQPAASRILAEVESRCGSALFIRTPKGMEATPVGDAFAHHARVVLSGLDSLEHEVSALTAGTAGEVRIGTVTGPAVGLIVPAMAAVRALAPGIAVSIDVGPSTELVRGLDEGRFDFILARIPATHDSTALQVHPARSEVVRLLVRECHPLAGRRGVGLAELTEYEWVIQERGSPIRAAVEQAFHGAGTPVPHRFVNSSSLLMVLAMLASSDVIAPQSHEVAELLTGAEFGARLTYLDTVAEMIVTPYFVVRDRNRELPRAAQLFYEKVLRAL